MKLAAFFLIFMLGSMNLCQLHGQQIEEGENLLQISSSGLDLELADPDSLFMEANSCYQQGLYEAALERYNAVIMHGRESAELYYNMGNAAYRANSIGHAILYYEKALKLDPAYEDAIHNLEFVSRYRADAFEEVPVLFLSAWISGFVQLFPEHTWSILAMIFFLIILCGLLFYLFSTRLAFKKAGFISGLAGNNQGVVNRLKNINKQMR